MGAECRRYKICSKSKIGKSNFSNIEYLELTPLSQITDEDIKNCEFRFSNGVSLDFDGFYWKGYDSNGFFLAEGILTPKNVDYLRSKGYALPYMGLSVDILIEYGWIKLKE